MESERWLAFIWLWLGSLSLARSGQVIPVVELVTTDRLPELMTGEWMVEFYAPWCPACQQFTETWERFAQWAAEDTSSRLRVGKVDVSVETMLSGQFMVTQLPSIYHIREGEVRVYQSARSYSDLVDYIEEKKWLSVDPVPWWRSPTATHMRGIGVIFWLSEQAKVLQEKLEKEYQLPTYAVFIVIAIATIVLGLSLGGLVANRMPVFGTFPYFRIFGDALTYGVAMQPCGQLTVCCIEVCMRVCSRSKPRPIRREPPPDNKSDEPSQTAKATTEATPTKQGDTVARQRKNKSKKNADEAKD